METESSRSLASGFMSTVGKKIIMAATGLGLLIFVISHMLGNLSFLAGADAFNLYSYKLTSLGPLLFVLEIIILLGFIFHAFFAVNISIQNRGARSVKYRKVAGAGKPSMKSSSSVSMIYTGILVLIFLVIHIKSFKYGAYYETVINGITMRDLYTLVKEKFHNPLYAFGYSLIMILLGFHLRHGFWSAFQSLGANHPRYSTAIYSVGLLIAVLLTIGFVAVPMYVYFLS